MKRSLQSPKTGTRVMCRCSYFEGGEERRRGMKLILFLPVTGTTLCKLIAEVVSRRLKIRAGNRKEECNRYNLF